MSGSNRRLIGEDLDGAGSLVSGPPSRQLTTLQKLGVAGLIALVFLGFIWLRALDRRTDGNKRAEQSEAPALGGQQLREAPITPPVVAAAPALPMPAPAAAILAPPGGHTVNPADSPIMAYAGQVPVTPASAASALMSAAAPAKPALPPAQDTALSVKLKATVLAPTRARLLPHPDFMLTMGTIIPCTLQTAINSELAGYVKCVIPQDIRSTTGDVVLLDKGTTVVGEIQQGLLQGQDRVFVIWDRAETPDHAVIDLTSPGTDQLGRSGLPGAVDNHLLQRFGAAVFLSLIEGGLQAGTALAANSGSSNTGLTVNSFQTNGETLANSALQNAINIPPTLEKNQGDNVAIFVAKDLDFSDVYSLRVNGAAGDQ